ncbi:MAG: hypothetical protein FWF72_01830 [Paludibacter sp.]|nr:hypothetical protein [Paludibacter sp.]
MGSKSTFLMLPVVSIIAYIGITLLQKIPHFYNYATIEITEDNAPRIYQIAVRMFTILKLLMVVIFMLITMQILQDIFHIFEFMRFWIIWAVLGLEIITMIYSFRKMYANRY